MSEIGPGSIFAGHRIDAVAGRGGMGVVYRAQQLDLDRPVALKVITPALAQDEAFRGRFVRESRAAAAIDHPNVIPIYYAGDQDDVLYIAMRYVEGPDLRALVRSRGMLDPQRAARLVSQVGAALDAAHRRGIVHRDVKPENVLIGTGDHPYLTDFGLTKRLDSHGGAPTRPGGWVGTLGYVAPEQIRGEHVDARADVYALGCLLVFALTGRAPFRRDSEEATLWAHLSEPPPKVSEEVPGLPPAFDDVVARALAKDPAQRYPSAGDLGRAALAAAGLADPDPLERSVATGAAAWDRPTAAPGEGATIPMRPTAPTPTPVHETPPTPGAPAGSGSPPSRRRGLVIGAIAAVLVGAGVVLAVVLGGGGGDAGGDATTARQTTTKGPKAPQAITVHGRPNGVALAGGLAWVLRNPVGTLATVDTATGRRAPYTPNVGSEPSAIAEGFGKVWVASPGLARLIPIDARTHRQDGAAAQLPPGRRPVSVAADSRSIWVGLRSFGGASLVKIDPNSRQILQTIVLPYGLQAITTGGGAVWVRERDKRKVRRIDTRTGAQTSVVVGHGASGIAYGEGAVWVTNSDDDTVTRIDADTRATTRIAVGRAPAGIAVSDGSVWVADGDDTTVTRIDASTSRADPEPIVLPDDAPNPYAVAAGDGLVWVTSPPGGTVTRIEASRG